MLAVNIRTFVLRSGRLTDLVELGSLTPRAAAFLEASMRAGLNILVAGGTQAGATHHAPFESTRRAGGDRRQGVGRLPRAIARVALKA